MKRRRFISNTLGLASLTTLGPLARGRQQPIPDSGEHVSPAGGMKDLIGRGDIERNRPPAEKETWIPLYQANGRFGTCYGPWGLHAIPGRDYPYHAPGAMRYTHLRHFMRGRFQADYLLPIAALYWESEPTAVTEYYQYQSFYDGTVTTRFQTSDYKVTVVSWFDPVQRDLAGLRIEASGKCPAIILSPFRKIPLIYDQHIEPVIETRLEHHTWHADIKYADLSSSVNVRSTCGLHALTDGLQLILREGRNDIVIGVNADAGASAAASFERSRSWWHSTWRDTAWLELPDEAAQKVWVRSIAYTLCSHNDDGIGCPPPTGLAGNAWPFPFPFDSGCRHPLLLSTGHVAAAKKWIEFWHAHIEGLREYTTRFYHTDGIFMPHVFPYGAARGFHDPGPPNKYYYPVYNSALMVRMADQTAVMADDSQWTKTYAAPLIYEGAKFYLNHLEKGADGAWHLHLVPSISLDESGDVDKPDYFSGLASARFALQKAVDYGLDSDGRMKAVLDDGVAFGALVADNGIYKNHPGQRMEDMRKQKHPDQLFPLVHLPMTAVPDVPTQNAHAARYSLADGAQSSRFIGHSLGEFILSSARMHDAPGWEKDWSMIFRNRYMDADLIQFFESSGNDLSFYITTHGLFAQALLETVVSTWWDRLDLGKCMPWKGGVRFGNIRTLSGVTVSGEIGDTAGEATLIAWKDTTFPVNGKSMTMRKGETRRVRMQNTYR